MKIGTRQLLFFLAAVAPVGKLVLMPPLLANLAKNDLLFPAAANFALQAAAVFCALLTARQNETLPDMLRRVFGKVPGTALTVLFALFLLVASFLPILEQKLLVQNIFYDTLPSYIAFAPMFLFAAYLCAKPLRVCGRTWDILAPIAAASLLGILLLSVAKADYAALRPVGAAGAQGFWRGFSGTSCWFFDAGLVLTLCGRFRYEKGLAWKGALCYLAGGAAVLFFLATFYGVFSEIAVMQNFAFARISKYFSGITAMGRIDYVFIFALAFVMLFYTLLPVQAAVTLTAEAFGNKKIVPPLLSSGIQLALLVLMLTVNFIFSRVVQTISGTLFWLFPLCSAAIPILLVPAAMRRRT